MVESRTETLREAVLGGRFLGAAAARPKVAEFAASADRAKHLEMWFGVDWLRGLSGQPAARKVLRAALDRDIAALDGMISAQLDAVLHHPRLRRLEGAWRGLQWLVARVPPAASRIRLKILAATWREVCKDIDRALEFDQSQLFRKIYEEQFGIAGGQPFGLMALDYEVRHRPGPGYPTDDIGALTGLAGIAAAAFAPMILAAAPELLGLDSFADVPPSFDPARALQDGDHQRWRQLAAQEDSRFIGVALPRVLARAPWVDDGSRTDGFRFHHHAAGPAQRVWTSPVYGFAATAVRAFDRYSWPGELRGADVSDDATGGVLDQLPFECFHSDQPVPGRAPLEIALTDEQEDQLSHAGLIPLAAIETLAEACFGALPSLHRPPRMAQAAAESNQRISAQINTLMCACRFAHCVKLMGRDMIGSFLDPQEVERRLQVWLNGYIGGSGFASSDTTARYPLREARVEVRERRGATGVFTCMVHLVPHHQLDDIGASFRLATEFSHRNASA